MIHPAILAFWAYPFAALAVGVLAVKRDLVAPAVVVWLAWLAGIAWQLVTDVTPLWLYLAMDTAALVWFFSRRDGWLQAFGVTFGVQVALHLVGLTAEVDALAMWWAHTATAFAQLLTLGAAAMRWGRGRTSSASQS